MCQDCGCALGGEVTIHPDPKDQTAPEKLSPSVIPSPHATLEEGGGNLTKTLELKQGLLAKNDRLAERNRGYFLAKNVFTVNVLSSPGSGKTTWIQKTLLALGDHHPGAVIVGDLATENDAARLRQAGITALQITTGDLCHLEADMIARALPRLDLESLDFLFIENVGNLVCPAAYDLGESLRIVLFSVTEGEDKPLKYPTMFKSADVIIISKSDLAEAVEFDQTLALQHLQQIAPQARIFMLSAKTAAGMEAWLHFLHHLAPAHHH